MDRNLTGIPTSDEYYLGRGILYVAELDANGKPKGYRDLGNTPGFKITVEGETLEHQSSRSGLKKTDVEIQISQKLTLGLTLENFSHENLVLLFSGAKADHTNVSVAGFVEHEMVAAGTIELGRYYDLVNSSGERAYDIDAANLTVKTTNATPVTLVKDTDYTVDTEFGRIFLLSSSTALATAIGNSEGLDVTLTADAGAKDVHEVQALKSTAVTCALKFIGENPANDNKKVEVQIHQVKLKPSGDFNFISDELATCELSGVAEENTGADAASPTMTIRSIAAA